MCPSKNKQKNTCKYEGTKVFPGEETICSTPTRDSDGPNSTGVLSVEQTSSQCFLLPLKMLPRVEPVSTQVKTAEKALWKRVLYVYLLLRVFLFWKKEILTITKFRYTGLVPADGFSADKLGYRKIQVKVNCAALFIFPIWLAARIFQDLL